MKLVCAQCGASNRVPEERLQDRPVCGRCAAPLLPGVPSAVDDDKLARFIAHNEMPVLVDFWAEWCGPCKMMAPQFAAAAAQLPEVRFLKLDTESSQASGAEHRIRSIPTVVLFKQGKEVARHSGAVGAPDLLAWVRARL